MMTNKKVVNYIQYALQLRVRSPLCVSDGLDDATDCDVQKELEGNPFIPGTSLAGALRSYLEECADEHDDIDRLFGYNREPQRFTSRIQVSDLRFEDGVKLITRDGIRLEHKLAVKGAKFGMEAVDTGAVCKGFLVLKLREGDERERFEALVEQALAGLMYGEIRLGANKNRGYGEFDVLKAKKKVFSRDNIAEWLNFDREVFLKSDGNELDLNRPAESRYVTIRVPLKQKGGISIRSYSVAPGEPDYAHITSNDRPVIPGSSWNGAIRSRVEEVLIQLGIDSHKAYIDEWFGYVKDEPPDAKQSNIVVSESVIEGGVDLSVTRTQINRYDASVVSGAIYSERSHFDGTLVLEIKVRRNYYDEQGGKAKDDGYRYEPIVGMLLIAVKDIQNGYLAVGGQTAVGRGIFGENGSIELIGTEKDEKYFISAVSALLSKEKNE